MQLLLLVNLAECTAQDTQDRDLYISPCHVRLKHVTCLDFLCGSKKTKKTRLVFRFLCVAPSRVWGSLFSPLHCQRFCIFSWRRNKPPCGYNNLWHNAHALVSSTMRWERALDTQTPKCLRVAVLPQAVPLPVDGPLCSASSLWNWGSLCWAGPRVRSLCLLLALVSWICWRWADVRVTEKFIYSLILYPRFLMQSGSQGWSRFHPGQVSSSSQGYNYVHTHIYGQFRLPNSHHGLVFELCEESGVSEETPDARTPLDPTRNVLARRRPTVLGWTPNSSRVWLGRPSPTLKMFFFLYFAIQ